MADTSLAEMTHVLAPANDGGSEARVLFVGLSAYASHGGIQRFNRRVIDALVTNGASTRVLMLGDSMAQLADGVSRGTTFGAEGSRSRFCAALPRLARGTDTLLLGHINLLPVALLYRALRPRGRIILFAHGIEVWDDPRFRRRRRYEPVLLRATVDRIAAVSRYTREQMAAAYRLSLDRFDIFPNAVPLIPPQSHRPVRGTRLLAVSRLGTGEREKHVDKLIRAMPLVAAAMPEAHLHIIGDGPLRAEYQALADSLGVSARVRLLGSVDDAMLDGAYRDAAAFVLPSSKEGFGIVYLEAWLRGLPVIGSRFGAGGEIIDDGVDGFTVDPQDIDTLASRMTSLLADPACAERFAAAGRAKVERLYTDTAFARRLGRLCAGKPVRDPA